MQRSTAFFLGFVFLALLSSLAPGADDEAQFLGMAVATDISQNTDGLLVVTGIHHAIHADSLPATENLHVYTRWTGKGTHQIGVSLWNTDTEVTIAETSEEVDFGADPTTYCTFDLLGTRFREPGAYAVEVTLDGDTAAEYEVFVNESGQFPQSPQLALSVPAESGSVNDAGDASVTGIFEYFAFSQFPMTDSFAIVTVWFSGSGNYEHYTRILDPKGATIAISRAQRLPAFAGHMSVVIDTFENVGFIEPGTYTAVIYLDGEEVVEYPLSVIKG